MSTNSNAWRRVADLADIEFRRPYAYTVEGNDVLVYRTKDRIYAVQNTCPHYGAPLSDGSVDSEGITCPWHNARFNTDSGALAGPPALDDLQTYEIQTEDGALLLRAAEPPGIAMPSGSDSRRILIVGGGAAANACAETLRRDGFAGQISVVTAESEPPYDRPMLSKGFVKGMAEESWLPLRSEEFYSDLHIDLLMNRRVDTIHVDSKEVRCDNGDTYTADTIVLATGAHPRRLSITGWDLDGVHTLRSAADARRIRDAASDAETAVVIGAGFIGMELASDLRQSGLQVHVVAPEEHPMSLMFGDEIGKTIQRLHEDQGVVFHMGTKPKEILGEGRCREVRLFDDSTIEADLVVAGLGVEPSLAYLAGTELNAEGGVDVDERLETSVEGIYAAGDIALAPYPFADGKHRIEHWVVAEAQGMHVARSILGGTEAYATVPFFWTRQYETSLKYVGLPQSGATRRERGSVADHDGLIGYFSDGSLTAAAGLGRSDEILVAERIVAAGGDISPEQFVSGDLQ